MEDYVQGGLLFVQIIPHTPQYLWVDVSYCIIGLLLLSYVKITASMLRCQQGDGCFV